MMAQPFMGYPVTQGWGPTANTSEPAMFGAAHFHLGIDYDAPCGTPVYAPAAGTMTTAGWDATGFGNLATLRLQNGYSVFFGHLSAFAVAPGQAVAAGALLGYSGTTGNSTGCHVHAGALDPTGQYIDPATAPIPSPPAAAGARAAAPLPGGLTVFGRRFDTATLVGAGILAAAVAATLDS